MGGAPLEKSFAISVQSNVLCKLQFESFRI